MDRRGFLKGLGALLATSAMVRPAMPRGWPGSIPPLPDGYYVCIVSPWQQRLIDEIRTWPSPGDDAIVYEGEVGRWGGLRFIEAVSRLPVDVSSALETGH